MIENQLKLDLNDSRITSLVSKTADGRSNIYLLHAPELTKAPYIEYEILSVAGDIYSEGDDEESSVNIQIDIFTHGSYVSLRDAVKTVLEEKGYIFPSVGGFQSLYEDETKLYHCVLRFIKEI